MIESTPHTEYAPEHNDRYFRMLFEGSDEYAIVLLDAEGKITGWNQGAEQLLGWSVEEALGKPGALFFTKEDRQAGAPQKEIDTAKASGRADDTRWHVKKSGELFWASAVLEAVENEEGEVVGFAKIIRDKTEVKRYEEALEEKTQALQEKTEALEESNRRLESFASYVAHEVRSPLLGVSLTIDQLFDRYSNVIEPDDLERAREVKSTLQDIKRFVSELLTFSRLGTSEAFNREDVSVHQIVEQAQGDLRAQLEETAAEIEVSDLPEVYANPTQLRHLFRNLLSNALRYNESDVPRVEVNAKENDDAWVFQVTDNGVGISVDDQAGIFDLFKRAEEEQAPGIGVGLALSKRIVTAHGGDIWVDSEPGQGTTFSFTIPKTDLGSNNSRD